MADRLWRGLVERALGIEARLELTKPLGELGQAEIPVHAGRLDRRYDALFVLGFRFVYGIRVATPLAFGMEGMTHRRVFLL